LSTRCGFIWGCQALAEKVWLHPEVGWEQFEAGDLIFGYGKQEYNWYHLHVPTTKTYMDECGHFPCTVSELLQYNGAGTEIASLVLYFTYGQNDTVDSHIINCAIALKWVPDFCKSPEAVWMALQQWIPLHFWPHANMVLTFFGQLFLLFLKLEMAKTIWEMSCWDAINAQQLPPMIDAMLSVYQPNLIAL